MDITRKEVPVGFRFSPSDKEILVDYLLNKVTNQSLPSNAVIECDLYGDEKIWQNVFCENCEKSLYFFTKLKKKRGRGSRIERATAFGLWRAQKDIEIYYHSQHIGSKRAFSYVARRGCRADSRWTMTEYRLDGCLLRNVNDNDYVVCLIKKLEKKGLNPGGNDSLDGAVLEHYFGETNGTAQMEQTDSTDVGGDDSEYLVYSQACYSSSHQQIQTSPIESNASTSMEYGFGTQVPMLETRSTDIIRDDLRHFVYSPAYDSASQQQMQMYSMELSASTTVEMESAFETLQMEQTECSNTGQDD